MNDEDRTTLASAYLDEEATPDERALVETDLELLDEVARLRAVRALLGDVEPPAISTRELHLAAALDVWDRIPDTERSRAARDGTPRGVERATGAVSAPSRLSDRRRNPSRNWLVGAAAALVLVFAGGVAIQLNRAGSDDATSAPDAATESADQVTAGERSDAPKAAADSDTFADEELAATAQAEGGELDTGIDRAAPPVDLGLVALSTPDDLAVFAAAALNAPPQAAGPVATSAAVPDDLTDEQRELFDTTIARCLGVDIIVGPALYGDVSVIVGIDQSRNLAIAYVVDDCTEIARVRLP